VIKIIKVVDNISIKVNKSNILISESNKNRKNIGNIALPFEIYAALLIENMKNSVSQPF
jgi:hypothetical protein